MLSDAERERIQRKIAKKEHEIRKVNKKIAKIEHKYELTQAENESEKP